MKYIRTKDGIRDITGFVDKGSYWQNPNCGLDYIGKEHIFKQADTIEELCDVFVIKYPDQSHEITAFQNLAQKQNHITGVIVYGAIWTEKCLMFVAFMNEKGELELL